jgi:hypothetical protein
MTYDIHAHVTELTRTHIMGTAYATIDGTELRNAYHYVRVPALLVQLQNAAPTSTGDSGASGGGSKSQPPTHIEALDTLHHIDRAAAEWVRKLGHDDPATTIGCVIKLGSLHPSAGNQQTAIERDVRRWWTQARVVTGIDSPAWRPDNTCPLCSKRGTLRVNRDTMTGLCIDCRETWSEENIGLLAEHIKAENFETTGDAELPDAS